MANSRDLPHHWKLRRQEGMQLAEQDKYTQELSRRHIMALLGKTELDGGITSADLIDNCNLDFSVASLHRIDAMLDVLRTTDIGTFQQFLSDRAGINFLLSMMFYVVKTIELHTGIECEWIPVASYKASNPACNSSSYAIPGMAVVFFPINREYGMVSEIMDQICARMSVNATDFSVGEVSADLIEELNRGKSADSGAYTPGSSRRVVNVGSRNKPWWKFW